MIVGVMDSGIGGLTTLSSLMRICGGEFVYVRDKKGPYGDKEEEFVLERTKKACSILKKAGAGIIVIACNTATNVAIGELRKSDCGFTYVGVEPAVKPALKECASVAVALTPTAARQKKFLKLIEENKKIKLITDSLLAPAIEKSLFCEDKLDELALRLLSKCDGSDGLVLGCTHYVFLKERLRKYNRELKIFDGNDGVAKRMLAYVKKSDFACVRFLQTD